MSIFHWVSLLTETFRCSSYSICFRRALTRILSRFITSLQNWHIAVNFAFPRDAHFGHSRGAFFDNFMNPQIKKKHVELVTQYILQNYIIYITCLILEHLVSLRCKTSLYCYSVSVQRRSFFWSVFSCIRTEYRKIRTRKLRIWTLFTRCGLMVLHYTDFLPKTSSTNLQTACVNIWRNKVSQVKNSWQWCD